MSTSAAYAAPVIVQDLLDFLNPGLQLRYTEVSVVVLLMALFVAGNGK
jgi:Sec-independent protein secretion pathway component TatC